MPQSPHANSAAAGSIVDEIFSLIDKGIDLVGEDALTSVINEKLDIPVLTESMEAVVIGYLVKKVHAAVHKAPVSS